MAPKPLEILRKGLDSLQKEISAKRDHLLAQLADKKSISSSDEHWLDNDANIAKEQFLLDTLDKESDYERGIENLEGHRDEAEGACRGFVAKSDQQKET